MTETTGIASERLAAEAALREMAGDASYDQMTAAAMRVDASGGSLDAEERRTGGTALARAATAGNLEAVEALLDRGARPDVRGKFGETPLHAAARSGSVGCCKALLDAGATLEALDVGGLSPLGVAAGAGRDDAVVYLVDQGARDRAGGREPSALAYAVSRCGARAATSLLAAGADADAEDAAGTPLLVRAAERGEAGADVVVALLAAGADPRRADRAGLRAIDLARAQGSTALIEPLAAALAARPR